MGAGLPQGFWLPGQEVDDIPFYTGSEWRGKRRPTVASFLTHTGSRGGLAWTAKTASGIDHGGLAGLTDDDHTGYARLAGRSGGQTLIGGTAAADNLVLRATGGVGTTALVAFQVGNNGATEAGRFTGSGGLSVNAAVDPGAGVINANTGYRIGNAAASGNVMVGNGTNFVAASTAPVAVSYTGSDFASSAGTLTVASGDLISFFYVKIGRFMHVSWEITTATLATAAAAHLTILIPGGFSAAERAVGSATGLDNGTVVTPKVLTLPLVDATKIYVYRDATGTNTWAIQTDTLQVQGSISFWTT